MARRDLKFEYPRHVRFRCNRCAICCGDTESRVRTILLMKCEARSISHKTSKTIDIFAEMKENSHPYIYQMKKTDSGKCIFLRNNECTIYQARPLICRFYPFELKNTEESRYIFAFTEECPSIGKGHELNRRHFEKLFVRSTKLTEKNARQH